MKFENGLTLGVDVGGGHILSALIDDSGRILESSRSYVALDSKASKSRIFGAWETAMGLSMTHAGSETFKGIGFAMPGAFDYKRGIALFRGNDKFEALYGVDIGQAVTSFHGFQGIPVRFINDATAFAVGEASFGTGRGYDRVVAVTLGTGLGSAFVSDGIPIVNTNEVPQHGCLWHLPYEAGIADDYFGARWFLDRFRHKTSLSLVGVADMLSIHEHRETAIRIFEEFGVRLGRFLGPWLKRFRADVLVLGGGITRSAKLFLPSLSNNLEQANLKVDIRISDKMEDASLAATAKLFDKGFWAAVKDDLPDS